MMVRNRNITILCTYTLPVLYSIERIACRQPAPINPKFSTDKQIEEGMTVGGGCVWRWGSRGRGETDYPISVTTWTFQKIQKVLHTVYLYFLKHILVINLF